MVIWRGLHRCFYKYCCFLSVMTRTLFAFLLFAAYSGAVAQPVWKLKKDDDGIRIYTGSTDTSEYKLLKVELEVDASASQVVSFLKDVERQPEWIYGVTSARMLSVTPPDEFIYYSEVDLPWPCSDRDYVAHLNISHPAAGLTMLDSHAEPGYIAEKKGFVRVRTSVAHWEIRSLAPDRQSVTYTLSFNPGGLIPPWHINMFLTKGPSTTFKKFREGVNQPRYRTMEASLQKEGS